MKPASPFMFGVRHGVVSRAEQRHRESVASRHDCSWIYTRDPGQGLLSWFEAPNRGDPFNSDLARRVAADLAKGES